MIDGIVLGFGLVLLLFAVIMTAVYLANEKGSLLDPITISWAGHALFIGGGMILVALLRPERGRDDVVLTCALLMLVGTFTYTVGLYMGKQKALARMLPTPRPTLRSKRFSSRRSASTTFSRTASARSSSAPPCARRTPSGVRPRAGSWRAKWTRGKRA